MLQKLSKASDIQPHPNIYSISTFSYPAIDKGQLSHIDVKDPHVHYCLVSEKENSILSTHCSHSVSFNATSPYAVFTQMTMKRFFKLYETKIILVHPSPITLLMLKSVRQSISFERMSLRAGSIYVRLKLWTFYSKSDSNSA